MVALIAGRGTTAPRDGGHGQRALPGRSLLWLLARLVTGRCRPARRRLDGKRRANTATITAIPASEVRGLPPREGRQERARQRSADLVGSGGKPTRSDRFVRWHKHTRTVRSADRRTVPVP